LRWDDIDLTTGRLRIRRAKGVAASAHSISAHSISARSISARSISARSISARSISARSISAHAISAHSISAQESLALRRLRDEAAPSHYVFASEHGAPFGVMGYERMIARAGAEAGFGLWSARACCGESLLWSLLPSPRSDSDRGLAGSCRSAAEDAEPIGLAWRRRGVAAQWHTRSRNLGRAARPRLGKAVTPHFVRRARFAICGFPARA
jgi:hypothetical protein